MSLQKKTPISLLPNNEEDPYSIYSEYEFSPCQNMFMYLLYIMYAIAHFILHVILHVRKFCVDYEVI